MKRNIFLLSILAAFPLNIFSFTQAKSSPGSKGFKINSGEGRFHGHIQLKGVNSNILDVKVSGKDTNGELAIFEQTSISQGKGTPLHIHPSQDEIFYIIEGEYEFEVAGDRYSLKTGDTIFLPRKQPHRWTQVTEKGKVNVIFQPAGKMEEFFLTLAAKQAPPDQKELVQIFADHEMEVVGPPLQIK